MDTNVERLLQRHDEFVGYWQALYHDLTDLDNLVRTGKLDARVLVDLGYLCREMANYADELRKEATARQELIGKLIAVSVAQQNLEDPSADQTVRGDLANGTPDVTQAAALPKFGTPEYDALCKFLGLTGTGVQRGIVGFSFTRLSALVTEMAGKGQNPPPGVLKTYPKFTTVFVGKRKTKKKEGTDDGEG